MDPEPKFITINLDVADHEELIDGIMYGPFETYAEATDYGNHWMSFFAVREIWEPISDT